MASLQASARATTTTLALRRNQPASLVLGRFALIRTISSTPIVPKEFKEGSVEPTFYVKKTERGGDKSVFVTDGQVSPDAAGVRKDMVRLARNDRACPTRELNFTPETWGIHKSPYRKWRHMTNLFISSPFQRLSMPDLAGVGAVATGVTFYNTMIADTAAQMLTMSSAGFGAATTAIGLLAGFKLNASYGRYEECRIFWGDINNTIRDMGRQTMMWMEDEDQRNRMLKLCQAFPMTHMWHVHAKGCHHNIRRNVEGEPPFEDRIHAEFLAELRDIYNDGKFEADFERLNKVKYNGGNTPLEVLTMMGETVAGSKGSVDPIYAREIDEQMQRLCAAYGASERVLRTPLPTGYSRHSSRLLWIWSHCLPFALYPVAGPIGTIPASILGSWAILGIEDLGVQLEEPFDVLPMRQYSDGMYDAMNQIRNGYQVYAIGSDERVKSGDAPAAKTE